MRVVLAAVVVALVAGTASAAPRARPSQSPPAAEQAPTASVMAPEEILRRANGVLNGMASLTAGFQQTAVDGRASTGRLYVQRTGGMRFDYDAPASLEIVSDGATVVVRDRKLNTSDSYPVSQTPLAFLLKDRVDIARDFKLTGASSSAAGAYVGFESASTFVGTSRIALMFDDAVTQLRGWRVVDAQGKHTVVSLSDIDTSPIEDARTFDIRFQRKQ